MIINVETLISALVTIITAVIGVIWSKNKYRKQKHIGRDDKSVNIKDSTVENSFNNNK